MAKEPAESAATKPAEQLQRSARAVEKSTERLTDTADIRTTLAGDRTLLAAERTYAAWVRTALAALASGIGARALLNDVVAAPVAKLSASALVAFAGFCLIAAVWRQLNRVVPPPDVDLKPLPTVLLVPINFMLMLIVLAALIGIWTA